MAEEKLNNVDKETENKTLNTAMFYYGRFESKEKKAKELAEKVKKYEKNLKEILDEKKSIEREIAEVKEEMAFIRKYVGLSRETSNLRKQFAVKGFFDLVSLLDKAGERDVTEAYNFIGNTEWLSGALMRATMINGDKSKITIDANALREEILSKKKELDKAITDAKQVLEKEWKSRQEKQAEKKAQETERKSDVKKEVSSKESADNSTNKVEGADKATVKVADKSAEKIVGNVDATKVAGNVEATAKTDSKVAKTDDKADKVNDGNKTAVAGSAVKADAGKTVADKKDVKDTVPKQENTSAGYASYKPIGTTTKVTYKH